MNRKLAETLANVDKPTETWTSPDGSAALVLPYGGRILGLFAPESERNFFWTNPALGAAETARAYYQREEWHNSGGDRTWLSPEVDFFLPDFPKLDRYWQPREFDPGNYQVTQIERRHPVDQSIYVQALSLTANGRSGDEQAINARLEPLTEPRRRRTIELCGLYLAHSLGFWRRQLRTGAGGSLEPASIASRWGDAHADVFKPERHDLLWAYR